MLTDGRLQTALTSDLSYQNLLVDLHRQILYTRDPIRLTTLLGKYVATAAARAAQTQPLGMRATTIANILRSVQDVANNSIQNYK